MEIVKKINKFLNSFRNFIFSCLIIGILGGISIYIIRYKEIERVSLIENRNLYTFEEILNMTFGDGSFQDLLENATADQFVERYTMVTYKKKLDQLTKTLFIPVNDDDYILNSIGDTGLFQVGDSNYVMLGLMEESDTIRERYREKAEQINALAADYPDLGIYVYKPVQVHETTMFDEKNEFTSYGREYNDILRDTLKVPYAELQMNTVADYKRYFYAQDHHWNYQGSYQGYVDIIHMIKGSYEEVLLPTSVVTSNDRLMWAGTMGSRTGYILDPEPFYYYTFDLPEYHVDINGVEQKVENMNNVEEQLTYKTTTYYYDYLGANNNYWQHFYVPGSDDPTLLIIGDSYASAIEPLLTAHFSEIWFIQPLNYYWTGGYGAFDIDKFIEETGVDNILIMYTAENYFLDDTSRYFNLARHGVLK